jgi:hypothetical protein
LLSALRHSIKHLNDLPPLATGLKHVHETCRLVAVYHPDDYDPSVETEATIEEIHALNRELIAAGARKFACGLSPAGNAKSLRAQPDGKVLVTDGPYTETKEHMGGFWILEAADLDEALAWARKGAVACRASGEVREILFNPDPKGATE